VNRGPERISPGPLVGPLVGGYSQHSQPHSSQGVPQHSPPQEHPPQSQELAFVFMLTSFRSGYGLQASAEARVLAGALNRHPLAQFLRSLSVVE
jgi:hypothetical protein